VLCLYFMGLNLSNRQIAEELGLSGADVQLMTERLRHCQATCKTHPEATPGIQPPLRSRGETRCRTR
jgi:hypothetical protein